MIPFISPLGFTMTPALSAETTNITGQYKNFTSTSRLKLRKHDQRRFKSNEV